MVYGWYVAPARVFTHGSPSRVRFATLPIVCDWLFTSIYNQQRDTTWRYNGPQSIEARRVPPGALRLGRTIRTAVQPPTNLTALFTSCGATTSTSAKLATSNAT